jgi:hypothetical protein
MTRTRRILGRQTKRELAVESLQTKRDEFVRIWSDPTDGRTESEVAKALGVETALVRSWRSDPLLMASVEQQFRSALRGDAVSLWRSLRRSAEAGSLGASRLLLETMGVIEGKGGGAFGAPGAAQGGPTAGSELNDQELDREIQRLLLDTGAPDGLEWVAGTLRTAMYEVLQDETALGADDAEVAETASVQFAPGEAT